MPLHLNSITNDTKNPTYLAHILGPALDKTNGAIVASDKIHFAGCSDIVDVLTNTVIGKYIYTFRINDVKKVHEIVDIDMILSNQTPVTLDFISLLNADYPTEHYEVQTIDTEQHLHIETVNRIGVDGPLENTKKEVYISAFPFEASLYKNMKELNGKFGFKKPIRVGGTDFKAFGFSDSFISPGNMFSQKYSDKYFSFVIGTVENFRNVRINMGKVNLDFVLVQLKTALGSIPVAMGKEVFDIRKLKIGKIIAMNADIKANLIKDSDFYNKQA